MNDHLGITHKIDKRLAYFGKNRLVPQRHSAGRRLLRRLQQIGTDAMNAKRFRRHRPFWVDVDMKGFACRHVVEQFNRTNFHDPVA